MRSSVNPWQNLIPATLGQDTWADRDTPGGGARKRPGRSHCLDPTPATSSLASEIQQNLQRIEAELQAAVTRISLYKKMQANQLGRTQRDFQLRPFSGQHLRTTRPDSATTDKGDMDSATKTPTQPSQSL